MWWRFSFTIFFRTQRTNTKKIILVAPWLDIENYLKELNPKSDYFNFKIDTKLPKRTEIICVYSSDDYVSTLNTVEKIKKEIPEIQFKSFTGKGHFTEPGLGSKKFPELLEIILK